MLFVDSVYVGIDSTSGHKAFTYAALDKDLNLISLADGEMEDVTAFLAAQKNATVAVNAPSGLNLGLVREKMKKEMLTPHQIRGAELRLAEYELRERGISISGTPSKAELCPSWMQTAFELYRKLKKMGFVTHEEKGVAYRVLETHPHACFCALVGKIPFPKPTLEGRLQRQLVLYERGLKIKDPMDFFEEITRYKLMKGNLPTDLIYLPEMLDALVAAYTAWLAVEKPAEVIRIGNRREGCILVPASSLKEKY